MLGACYLIDTVKAEDNNKWYNYVLRWKTIDEIEGWLHPHPVHKPECRYQFLQIERLYLIKVELGTASYYIDLAKSLSLPASSK